MSPHLTILVVTFAIYFLPAFLAWASARRDWPIVLALNISAAPLVIMAQQAGGAWAVGAVLVCLYLVWVALGSLLRLAWQGLVGP